MSNHVVSYASGLPLAIKLWASYLFGKSIREWKCCLNGLEDNIPTELFQRLEDNIPTELFQIFQLTFNGLNKTKKEVFLLMACFFSGEDRNRTTDILDSLGLFPNYLLGVLVDKSLLNVSLDGKGLWMHTVVQQMGREIVCRECPEWLPEDIDAVLTDNKVSNYVEIFNLNIDPLYY